VWRAATHHGAERDDRLVASRRGQAFGGDRDLECAGYLHHAHVIIGDTVLGEGRHRAFQQSGGDGRIEARHHDGEARAVNGVVGDLNVVFGHDTIRRKNNAL